MFLAAILIGAALSTGAKAQTSKINLTVNMDIASCAKLLESVNAPTPFDFAISDLEGLYIELLEDSVELSSPEIFLKKKAEFFNRLNAVFPKLLRDNIRNENPAIPLVQLVNMMMSLGVGPEFYGLKLDENSQISIDKKVYQSALSQSPSSRKPAAKPENKKSIGFVEFRGEGEEPLPAYLRRSVGFAPFRVERRESPKRRGGQLKFEVLSDQTALRVIDSEENVIYELPLEALQTVFYESDVKKMGLKFDPNQGWIVAFESLVNPDGVIGFKPL